VVEGAVLFSKGALVTAAELPPTLPRAVVRAPLPEPEGRVSTLQQAVERAEAEAVRAALRATEGRRSAAAELLGVSRKTLWEKLKLYGLSDE
jgi:DNA-binding NtrC family response regulator